MHFLDREESPQSYVRWGGKMISEDSEVFSVAKMDTVHISEQLVEPQLTTSRERPVSFVFLAVLGLETESCWLTTPMRIGGRWV